MAPTEAHRMGATEILAIGEETNYVPTIFLTHELGKPTESQQWLSLLTSDVVALWLVACERAMNSRGVKAKRNKWILLLELSKHKFVSVELKKADSNGNTITICRPFPPKKVLYTYEGSVTHFEGYAFCVRSDVKYPATLNVWLDQLEKSGVTRYRLSSDFGESTPWYKRTGRRFWIWSAMRQWQCFLPQIVPHCMDSEMKNVWGSGYVAIEWEEIQKELPYPAQGIEPGDFLPTKWPMMRHERPGFNEKSTNHQQRSTEQSLDDRRSPGVKSVGYTPRPFAQSPTRGRGYGHRGGGTSRQLSFSSRDFNAFAAQCVGPSLRWTDYAVFAAQCVAFGSGGRCL
ncbi:Uu.00g033600.m01.CDS01 [Anthostomella pinea]|uniref:Uu.00g033600.m01.CDS01 n=1 Tax=Anthostomella pinea TaxID=933095 RepID=A0AAI8YDA3_9PEZI|nr:Uu.00g033600.m01.CDS01 [Anthostomella pinea]